LATDALEEADQRLVEGVAAPFVGEERRVAQQA